MNLIIRSLNRLQLCRRALMLTLLSMVAHFATEAQTTGQTQTTPQTQTTRKVQTTPQVQTTQAEPTYRIQTIQTHTTGQVQTTLPPTTQPPTTQSQTTQSQTTESQTQGVDSTLPPFYQQRTDAKKLAQIKSTAVQQHQATLNSLKSPYQKDLTETYTLRWKNILEKIEQEEFLTWPQADLYLQGIFAEIVKANPSLSNQSLHCYFSRSGVPNASYLGEGIIIINIGLMSRLEDESQLAFVILHEIAHWKLRHSEDAIETYVNKINSKEFQQQLKSIKKTSYGRREQLEKLVTNLSFSSRRHTRQNETQADSMALAFLLNTRFNPEAAAGALRLLDIIDTDSLDVPAVLKRHFNSAEYPFKSTWLRKEEGLLGGHARLSDTNNADSLKTHPDCSKRIEYINKLMTASGELRSSPQDQGTASQDFNIDPKTFQTLQHSFRYEVVQFYFESGNYSRSLFHSFQLLDQHPTDPYPLLMIGKSLNKIYEGFKEHRLSKVTDLPSPDFSKNYNELCQFIQNLYAENLAAINYHFMKKHKTNIDSPSYKEVFETAERNTKN